MVYSDITETSKVYVREASMVPVYALLLFGGKLTVHHVEGLISLDNWAKFKAPAQIATLVRPLRRLTLCAAQQVLSHHEAFNAVCRGPLCPEAEPCTMICTSAIVQVDGLRKEVEQLLLRKIEDPGLVLGQNKVVEAMLGLLSHDGF